MSSFTSAPFRQKQRGFGGKWKPWKSFRNLASKYRKKGWRTFKKTRRGQIYNDAFKKGGRKGLAKRFGRDALKYGSKAAIAGVGGVGLDYAQNRLLGMDPLTAEEQEEIAADAALSGYDDAMSGRRITPNRYIRDSANRVMARKPRRKVSYTNQELAKHMKRMQRYMEAHSERKRMQNNPYGYDYRMVSPRAFGSGKRRTTRKRKSKGKKRKPKKKRVYKKRTTRSKRRQISNLFDLRY